VEAVGAVTTVRAVSTVDAVVAVGAVAAVGAVGAVAAGVPPPLMVSSLAAHPDSSAESNTAAGSRLTFTRSSWSRWSVASRWQKHSRGFTSKSRIPE
jgi:hypothetical protein